MIFQLLSFVYLITAAFSSPVSPHLFCEEKRWQSIFAFFTTNYIAHALTTIPAPGTSWSHFVLSIRALLLPNVGLVEAINGVICHFVQGRSDDLHRALAQKALLILVKTEDIAPGDVMIPNVANFFRVHGEIVIPSGYALISPSYRQHRDELVPAFRKSKEIMMGRSAEVASAVIAIAQVIFSSITIYRTRGDQIEKYGYAAYGLSAYPYALMSLANLIKLAVCGRYPFLYVLRTATLVEAEKNGGVFEGAVGNLEVNRGESDVVVNDPQHDELMAAFSEPPSWVSPFRSFRPLGDYRNHRWIVPIIGSLVLVIAFISHPVFVLLVSGFNRGQSTRAQRIWMLGWLIANEVSAVVGLVASESAPMEKTVQTISSNPLNTSQPLNMSQMLNTLQTLDISQMQTYLSRMLGSFLGVLVVSVSVYPAYVFAIGGFVTVGRMLRAESYQLCNI